MASATPPQPFRFLDLPIELRDDIYELAIFDIPVPDPDRGLSLLMENPRTSLEDELKAGKLHPNILLSSQQVFEEANSNILRRGQLVSVTVQSIVLCYYVGRALAGSQIAVLPAKCRNFCTLRRE